MARPSHSVPVALYGAADPRWYLGVVPRIPSAWRGRAAPPAAGESALVSWSPEPERRKLGPRAGTHPPLSIA